jgi:iron complex transport system substrate-binding protein
MAGRSVTIPEEIHRVFPLGHAMPIALSLAPEKVAVVDRVDKGFERFTPPSFRENKVGIGFASPERIKNPNLPRKRGSLQEDAERVKPDLILIEGTEKSIERANDLQTRTNTPVIVVDQDMHRYEEAFTLLGYALGAENQAGRMIGYLMKYLYPVHQRTGALLPDKKVKIYYAHGSEALNTEPAGNKHVQPLSYIHAINIFPKATSLKIENRRYTTTLDEIIRLEPDVILIATMRAEKRLTWNAIHNNSQWRQVQAVQNNRVYQIPWLPYSWFDRPPGSNRILGTIWLAKTVYPELFADLNLTEAVQEYFKVFYHLSITEKDVSDLLSMVDQGEK